MSAFTSATPIASTHVSQPRSYALPMAIIGVLFFIFGFITWLNGTLIPFLKLSCDLKSDTQALLVTFAFYMAYFCLALPSSWILKKTGFKIGMSLGLLVMAAGALIFIPAALTRTFSWFLAGLFVQGMGLSILQTASNPYMSVVGPIESAASRIAVMGICNKIAGALSPLILGAIVLKGAGTIEAQIKALPEGADRLALLAELSHRVIAPYAIMAGVLVVLAVAIRFSPLPEIDIDREEAAHKPGATAKRSIFQFPHLWLGVLCLFLYVGVEVMAGDVISSYAKSLGMTLDKAKSLTSYTMWSMVAAYLIGVFTIPRIIKQDTALWISAVLGIALAACAYFASGLTSIIFIALLGFANALMWPAIFPMAIEGLGRFTKTGSALLIMAIAGGAIIPQIYAHLAAWLGGPDATRTAFFWCILPCYLYIFFYAVKGHWVGRNGARAAQK